MEGTDQPEQIMGQLWVRACVRIEGEENHCVHERIFDDDMTNKPWTPSLWLEVRSAPTIFHNVLFGFLEGFCPSTEPVTYWGWSPHSVIWLGRHEGTVYFLGRKVMISPCNCLMPIGRSLFTWADWIGSWTSISVWCGIFLPIPMLKQSQNCCQ